jgi:hypothetical protein
MNPSFLEIVGLITCYAAGLTIFQPDRLVPGWIFHQETKGTGQDNQLYPYQ